MGMKILLFVLFLCNTNSYAAVINVPADYPRISLALAYSAIGDTVLVAPGVYRDYASVYGRVLGSWFLTTGDTSYISSTVIQGYQEGIGVSFYGSPLEYPNAVLSGFTIANFQIGVYCEYNTSPEISNCVIKNIGYREAGLGVGSAGGGSPVLKNVVLTHFSVGEYAEGVRLSGGNPVLENVEIRFIDTNMNAIGISCSRNTHATLKNVSIFQVVDYIDEVHSFMGTGIWFNDGTISIQNSIVSQCAYGIESSGGTIEISHSNIGGNFQENFRGLDPSIGLLTQVNANGDSCDAYFNISTDPQFVNDDKPSRVENRYVSRANLHLRPTSPCINTGTPVGAPLFDLEGNPRDALPDMGAYEYVSPEAVEETVPQELALLASYPNPFNAAATISFELPEPGLAVLAVYNVSGQKVRELAAAWFEAGPHSAVWDGCDDAGNQVSSGLYFMRLQEGRMIGTGKMVLLR